MGAYYQERLIPNREKSAHCSSIIELPNGNLMVSFYAGSAEANLDTKIYTCIYDKIKQKWEIPQVRLDIPNQSQGNAVLFINRKNRIYLFNNSIHREWRKFPRLWNWALTDNKFMYSDDLGETWSENSPLFPNKIGWNFKNKAIYLEDGTVLFSMYDDFYFKSYILISKDDGKNWEISEPIEISPHPSTIKDYFFQLVDKLIPIYGNIQPSLIEKNNGDILAYLRPKNLNKILLSISKDGGKTWSDTEKTSLKNPQSGIDAVKLANGNFVLVYNKSENSRSVLNLILSEDEGKTWGFEKILEQEKGEEFSYPAIIQDKEGFIHITYTYKRECIKHIKISEEWITS